MIITIFNKYKIPLQLVESHQYIIPKQPKETYYGNREYKKIISSLSAKKLEHRTTQCLFRIHEGEGKALYFLGIDDNGVVIGLTYNELCVSLENLLKIVNKACVDIYKIKIYYNTNTLKYCACIRLRKTDIEF
jgi:GTPase